MENDGKEINMTIVIFNTLDLKQILTCFPLWPTTEL